MKNFSYITQSHPSYIEQLYKDFLVNPDGIDNEYRKFFEGFDFAVQARGTSEQVATSTDFPMEEVKNLSKEFGVYQLIQDYAKKGHLFSMTNPIKERKKRKGTLDLSFFGLSEADLDTVFEAGKILPTGKTSLRNILSFLKRVYCGSIGLEMTSINDEEKIAWLQDYFFKMMDQELGTEERKDLLKDIANAVFFEQFLHTKYVGQKRFSLEGLESLVPALNRVITLSPQYGVSEVMLGMAHRGRLNVLANVLHKSYEEIFAEFEPDTLPNTSMGSGDVKYHLGYTKVREVKGQEVQLYMCANPSHLEAVIPVVLGFARSRADLYYEENTASVLPILMHGDAAAAGQGVFYEAVQMSKLKGYQTGGTLHIIKNNQVGFTITFEDERSSDYASSIASVVQAPVLHVNGDDLEAVIKCMDMAMAYRARFHEDVFVDIVGYRRHGHNEGDDPKFTQPDLYAIINKHPNVLEVYKKYLKQVDPATDYDTFVQSLRTEIWEGLQVRLDAIRAQPRTYAIQEIGAPWRGLRRATDEDFLSTPSTRISKDNLRYLFHQLMQYPEGFHPLKKIQKMLEGRRTLLENEGKVDWATAELLAYASILVEGHNVRLCGEDIKRGTFSHRHACVYDEVTGEEYNRLSRLKEGQGKTYLYNSLLSEYAALGFEYGYAIADPNHLIIWEAQFGDFANGAQIIIDQFLSGGEMKWNQSCGLVMLLPHGYEGQGPEHSSARMERFLQLCAENNMVVTNITEAANLFHGLRRQMLWPFRKPLINFTPKANLRQPNTYSLETAFTEEDFKEVIDCPFSQVTPPAQIRRVLLCSGKIYFNLLAKQKEGNHTTIAVVRLEQLYPFPQKQLDDLRAKYHNATWFWVQEEPHNMGAVGYLQLNWTQFDFGVISRNASAATSSGYGKIHEKEQQNIIDTAFLEHI